MFKLYKKDKKNGMRVWEVKVSDGSLFITHGLIDGQKIETEEKITGKNKGRSNETTDNEQAIKEAISRMKKKKDSGYSENLNDLQSRQLSPMLAQDYKKQKNVIFPVFIQPKLDGYRMIYDNVSDKIRSRTGKEYTILYNTDIHDQLKNFNYTLDGEIYVHDEFFDFENYGILRKKYLLDGDIEKINSLEYHVYDIIHSGSFNERNEILKSLKDTKNIKFVKSFLCKDKESIEKKNINFIEKGYEGTMVRSVSGIYSNNRSKDLLKYKIFDDHEFEVVGFEKETDTKGDFARPVVWVCITKDKKEFKVPSKGTREERTKLYDNGEKFIGRFLTVQFFGYTKDNIPRFPKTLRSGESSFIVKEF